MVMARELFKRNQIKTTYAKAKALQPMIEKLITNAKKDNPAGLTEIQKLLSDRITTQMLIRQAKDRFASRMSGYTKLVKLGFRSGDGANLALLSFTDNLPEIRAEKPAVKTEKIKPDKKPETKKVKDDKNKKKVKKSEVK